MKHRSWSWHLSLQFMYEDDGRLSPWKMYEKQSCLIWWETSRDDDDASLTPTKYGRLLYCLHSCLRKRLFIRAPDKNKSVEERLHFFAKWLHKYLKNIKSNWVNPNPISKHEDHQQDHGYALKTQRVYWATKLRIKRAPKTQYCRIPSCWAWRVHATQTRRGRWLQACSISGWSRLFISVWVDSARKSSRQLLFFQKAGRQSQAAETHFFFFLVHVTEAPNPTGNETR